MSILQEFKEFAMRGNVVDMAVGIIIGGAFGTIVNDDQAVLPAVTGQTLVGTGADDFLVKPASPERSQPSSRVALVASSFL